MRILVGVFFGLVAFEGLRYNIIFYKWGWRKKWFMLIGGIKSWKLFFEYIIDQLSLATFKQYLLQALAISCGSVKLRSLSKILDGATLGNSFNKVRFFPCTL